MEIGENIYKFRKLKGISQESLANELGVSRQSVSLWETNQTLPSVENLLEMSKIFGVTMDELCKGSAQIPLSNAVVEKDFLAHSVTNYNEEVYKLSLVISFKKQINNIWLIIVILFFSSVYFIAIDQTFYCLLSVAGIAGSATKLIHIGVHKKKCLNSLLSGDKLSMEFWFYNEHFNIFSKTDNASGNYTKRYDEIVFVIDGERYIFLYYNLNNYSAIDKLNFDGNLNTLISMLKGNAKKYRSGAEKIENKKLAITDKQANIVKTFLLILFVLTLLSLLIALMLILICMGDVPSIDDPSASIKIWLFYVVLPIPLSSLILGLYADKKGIKAKKNIIAGIIFSILLIIYGSFVFFI